MALCTLTSTNQAYNIPPLIANNYAFWIIKLELLLIRLELWGVINGSDASLVASDVVGLTT